MREKVIPKIQNCSDHNENETCIKSHQAYDIMTSISRPMFALCLILRELRQVTKTNDENEKKKTTTTTCILQSG